MFSAANVEGLEESGVKYVLALRARQQLEGQAAYDLAERAGLPRPQDEKAPWELREVSLRKGVRHVGVLPCLQGPSRCRSRPPGRRLVPDPRSPRLQRRLSGPDPR